MPCGRAKFSADVVMLPVIVLVDKIAKPHILVDKLWMRRVYAGVDYANP